jgi:LacI family transcriptional regulator
MLQARGISGLVVADLAMVEAVKADLAHYAVVAIGHGSLNAPFNRIVPDYQHDLRMTFDRLLELGYRRIGLHQTPYQMMITEGGQYAAYRLMQDRLPQADRLPVFNELTLKGDRARQLGALVAWLRESRVEALLINHTRLLKELVQAGLRVPEELGIVHLGHGEPAASDIAGIQHPVDHYGKATIDLLSTELLRNEQGLPPFPMKIALSGSWRAGRTLRPIASRAAATAAQVAGRMPPLDWYVREYAGGQGAAPPRIPQA